MDGVELFSQSLAQVTAVVKQIRVEHLANITPCPDWNVRDLIDHMLMELRDVPRLLNGEEIVASDELDEEEAVLEDELDLGVQWQVAADAADTAAADADPDEMAHPASGDVTNEVYLRQIGTDLLIHAWDLAVAVGMPIHLAPSPTLAAYDHALSNESVKQPSDDYSAPLPVAEQASLQTKLLALYGRSTNWRQVAA